MNFEAFLDQFQKVPVEEYPNQAPTDPLVSVCVQTYQHAPYIRECLDGILMQETTFHFEVLIGEDESSDGTREICIEYAKKYPENIRLFLHHRENNIKILGSPTGRFNSLYNFYVARGRYIAICEGDDYWIDPQKLQKQALFLEKNKDYGLVHGDSDIFIQEKNIWQRNANRSLSNTQKINNKKEQFERLVNADYQIRTATVLFRKELLKNRLANKMIFLMLDTTLWLEFSQVTKFKYFNEVWSVYRVIQGSASKPKSKVSRLRFILSSAEMRIHYHEIYNYKLTKKLKNKYNTALINYMLHKHDYEPKYSLFEPTIFEKFKLKYNQFVLTKLIARIELELKYHISSILKKL